MERERERIKENEGVSGTNAGGSGRSTPMMSATKDDEDEMKMDVDEVEVDMPQETTEHQIWGMPKWGYEEDRTEVRRGVRLLGAKEVSHLVAHMKVLLIISWRSWSTHTR